jgi:hypothetical protein
MPWPIGRTVLRHSCRSAFEDQGEHAAFGDAGEVFEQADIGIAAIDPGGRLPPVCFDLGPGKIEREVDTRFLRGWAGRHGATSSLLRVWAIVGAIRLCGARRKLRGVGTGGNAG